MDIIKIKRIIGLFALFSVGLIFGPVNARANTGNRLPKLPPVCENLQLPPGNLLVFHAYATGVQVYRWNGGGWDFVAPLANLFADSGYTGKVGFHYAGPTWESVSGSKVVARKVNDCTPNPSAIPWLKLERVSTQGSGIFSNVTFIHRVNTSGGLPPPVAGAAIGAEARVSYTAEYYFFQAKN